MNDIKEAMNCIIGYCNMQQSCEGCHFFVKEKDACFFSFSDLPCDWEMPEGKK